MSYGSQKSVTCCISLIILLLYIASLSMVEAGRGNHASIKKNVGVWNLPPVVLSVLAGEFRGLVADLLILEAGARVGTRVERTSGGEHIAIASDYNNQTIYEILLASQSLDPAFQQTFMLAQGWLPWDNDLVDETIDILNTAQDNRPWDFFPARFIAFNTYYFLNDYVQAGQILLTAAARKNAPSYFGILGARLSHKGGDTEAAIILMQTAIKGKDQKDPGYESLQDRLKALEGTLLVEQAVSKYQTLFSILPEQQEQLIESGILTRLPENPYELPYCINQHGKVFFDRPNCRELPIRK